MLNPEKEFRNENEDLENHEKVKRGKRSIDIK